MEHIIKVFFSPTVNFVVIKQKWSNPIELSTMEEEDESLHHTYLGQNYTKLCEDELAKIVNLTLCNVWKRAVELTMRSPKSCNQRFNEVDS